MDLRIGHLDFTPPPAPAKRTAEIRGIPPVPPLDALREMDRAAARAEELWRDKRELHFARDEYSGRVIVQVRDLEGRVIRTIPPSEALDVLSGRSL
jgi:FlaG protein